MVGIFEHVYPNHIARSEAAFSRRSDAEPWRISGFYVNVVDRSEAPDPIAALKQGSTPAWAMIAAAVVNALFILASVWAVLFWRGIKRRWLWLLVTIVGFVGLSMNMSTGEWGVQPIFVQLFGASAMWSGSVFDAWVVTVSAPLGALAFWLTRHVAMLQAERE